jgi:hypothetical protein
MELFFFFLSLFYYELIHSFELILKKVLIFFKYWLILTPLSYSAIMKLSTIFGGLLTKAPQNIALI